MISEGIFAVSQTSELHTWSELLWRFITFVFIFVFIIIIAYMTTKLIGKKSMIFTASKNLKVVDRISLGLDKSLYIIRLEDYFYLIAMGKQNIELIDKLSKDEIDISSDSTGTFDSSTSLNRKFDSYLNKYFTSKKEDKEDSEVQEAEKKEMLLLQKKLQQLKAQYQEFRKKTNKNDEDEQK